MVDIGFASMLITPTVLLRFTATEVCPSDNPEDQPDSRYRSPVVSTPAAQPVTFGISCNQRVDEV